MEELGKESEADGLLAWSSMAHAIFMPSPCHLLSRWTPSCGSQGCLISQSETPDEDPAWKARFLSYGVSYRSGYRPFPDSQRFPQNGPAYTLLTVNRV